MDSKQRYSEYLNSPAWKKLRMKALMRAGYRCQLCNSPKSLCVHHRKYPEVLGEEPITDLTVLCSKCHDNFHIKGATPKERRPPRYVSLLEKEAICGLKKAERKRRRKKKRDLRAQNRDAVHAQEKDLISWVR